MKQVIPFSKNIVFKTNIASITSISLEHEEKIKDGEVSGDFVIFGDYKIHNDTTEKELFKYRLPFTTLIPDDVDPTTIIIDVENFTYETIENDVLKVNIDFSIEGEEKEEEIVSLEEKRIEEKQEEQKNVSESQVVLNNVTVNKPVMNSAILNNIELEKNTKETNIETDRKEENKQERLEEEKAEKVEDKTLLTESSETIKEVEPEKIIEPLDRENTRDFETDKKIDREIDTFIDNLIIPETLPPIQKDKISNKNEETSNAEIINNQPLEKDHTSKNTIPDERPFPINIPSNPFDMEQITNILKKEEKDKMDLPTTISTKEEQQEQVIEKTKTKEEITATETKEENDEYVTYHIHIVKEEETLEMIMNKYNTNMDIISSYNDITSIKPNDKLIIPEYVDE